MANASENSTSIGHIPLPPEENCEYMEEEEEAIHESSSSSSLCCCFRGLALYSGRCRLARDSASRRHLLQQQQQGDQGVGEEKSWFMRGAKKAKEVSEVLAGPKWKNFIRRLSRCGVINKKRRLQLHYDPESYALNFDDGVEHRELADGVLIR